jgi:hypothetical protein
VARNYAAVAVTNGLRCSSLTARVHAGCELLGGPGNSVRPALGYARPPVNEAYLTASLTDSLHHQRCDKPFDRLPTTIPDDSPKPGDRPFGDRVNGPHGHAGSGSCWDATPAAVRIRNR